MIINLLALLTILATGAVAGVLLTIRYYEHGRVRPPSDEEWLAYVRDLPAPRAMIWELPPDSHRPRAPGSRGRLPN